MIYFDHNATSPPSKTHLQNLFSKLEMWVGNPSSPHASGRAASVALTESRRKVAQALGVDVAQLIFVSGASEANNIATTGVLRYFGVSLSQALTTAIEHPSVLEPLEYLQKNEGLNVTLLKPNSYGFISAQQIIENINPQTNYISLIAANNEVGSLQPVKLIGDYLHYKRWGVLPIENREKILELDTFLSPTITKENLQKLHFHVDAVQAFGKLKVEQWFSDGFDSCSVSGHKLGSLQGIGALFLRRGRKFNPLILGGAQEKNRRAGTENLPGIVSFGLICEELLQENWWAQLTKVNELRVYLYQELAQLPNIELNSPSENVIPNTVNFSVAGGHLQKNGEDLLVDLDLNGICASSGSACSSGTNLPSKVLLAMGKSIIQAKNAVRLSFSTKTTRAEIDELMHCLKRLFTP